MRKQIGIFALGIILASVARADVYSLNPTQSLEDVVKLAPSHLRTSFEKFAGVDLTGIQATNLWIDGHIVYVTYNHAGAGSQGALEAVDISDLKNPRPLSILSFDQFEFSDIAVSHGRAYIVGQEDLPAHQGAVLKMIDISDPAKMADLGSVSLPGYAAVSIQIHDCQAVVATGNNAGVSVLSLDPNALPTPVVSFSAANALYAHESCGKYWVLGGEGETSLSSFDAKTLKADSQVALNYQTTQSPARFVTRLDTAYVTAENAGFSTVDLHRATLLGHLPVPGTGNGLDLHGKYAYLAQGGSGLYVADVGDPSNPRLLGHLDFNYPDQSTNQVKYYGSPLDCGCSGYLIVANGEDGLRVFRLHGF